MAQIPSNMQVQIARSCQPFVPASCVQHGENDHTYPSLVDGEILLFPQVGVEYEVTQDFELPGGVRGAGWRETKAMPAEVHAGDKLTLIHRGSPYEFAVFQIVRSGT